MERQVTIIAPAAIVEAAREACAMCPGGAGMFVAAAGSNGTASHYLSAGQMGDDIIQAAEQAGCIVTDEPWQVALDSLWLVLLSDQ